MISSKKDIQTVYNFIDSRVYQKVDMDPLRCDLGIKPEEKVVIHVSNFRAVKRVDDVVRTFYKINQKLPAKLLLVGDGPEITKITKLVDDLKLQEAVLFLGKQDNLEELYSISDLMLLLSEKESFGLVALEAMACGVPCIGTNVGGIPEVIENDKTGYICEVSQIDQMAKTL